MHTNPPTKKQQRLRPQNALLSHCPKTSGNSLILIPLYDSLPKRYIKRQWVTYGIIAVNIVVFMLFSAAGVEGDKYANSAFGYIPSVANDIRILPAQYQIIPDTYYWLTAITASFIHADIFHLGGNMIFIWVFGDNVEDAMGHVKFLIFYLLCAVGAALFHGFTFPDSDAALIGASGAASGVLTAYLVLHPKVKIWALVMARIPIRLPAYILLGAWIAYQLVMYLVDPDSNISWASHVGGILTAIILVMPFKRWKVPLFGRKVEETPANLEPPASQNQWGRGAADKET